ncbi:hypothetical protein Leryth_013598 [Lithospermum erythrorhizon]|nr:hypothetical protein Leryth_013598 [Lithospermum erythrorhizon]
MADVVQFKLERMLNELDDLEKRGLFSRREIAEIVKQRRKFEYRLKRPSPLKPDFLAYIEYEKRLDDLRLLRKKLGTSKFNNKSLSDFASVSRIVDIYRLATTRFKGDLHLWFQYLEFCRQRRHGRMKKALAQVVRFHPKVPGVWIYAAAWEFDHNLNVESARALMQRGLRACPASEDLWVEYLRMELTYLNKLKARKVVLGEDEGTLARDRGDVDEKQWIDQNKDLFMALNDEKENHDGDSREKQDPFKEQGLKVLQVVYTGAIAALPSSFDLRRRFLEILEATDLSDSGNMQQKILSDMKRDFSNDPGYWDWLARLEGVGPGPDEENMRAQLSKAIQIYEEGLNAGPSAALFDLYVKFLMEAIDLKMNESQIPMELSSSISDIDLITHLLMTYEKAVSIGCITKDLACQHVSFLMQLGRLDEARLQVEKYCSGLFSNAVDLWVLRISIEARCAQKKPLSPIFELLKDVLLKVSISEGKNLWLMALSIWAWQASVISISSRHSSFLQIRDNTLINW